MLVVTMNDKRTTELELAKKGYIAAFMSANPGEIPPSLYYDSGWWKYYHRFMSTDGEVVTSKTPTRKIRTFELNAMTERLLKRIRT